MTSAIPVQCSTNWANEPTRTDHFFSPSLSYDMSVVDVQKLYCLHYSFSCSCVQSVLYQLRLTFSQNWLVNGTKARQNVENQIGIWAFGGIYSTAVCELSGKNLHTEWLCLLTIYFWVFFDKATERKILLLQLDVPGDGCEWIGELRIKEVKVFIDSSPYDKPNLFKQCTSLKFASFFNRSILPDVFSTSSLTPTKIVAWKYREESSTSTWPLPASGEFLNATTVVSCT